MKKEAVNAKKTAIGGLVMALSVVIMLPTALETFVYVLPALAGVLIMLCVIELNKGWSLGIYVGTALISMLFVPNREAAVLYTAFFGYYPILKSVIEIKLPMLFKGKFKAARVVEYIIKFLIFNVAVVISYMILVKVMGMPFNQLMGIDENSGFMVKFGVPIMLLMGNVVFILFDICLTRIASAYLAVWQKKFRKMFRF